MSTRSWHVQIRANIELTPTRTDLTMGNKVSNKQEHTGF